MSFGHFYIGYLMGQQQAQTDRHFEDFGRNLGSGKGAEGLVYLIPALEGIMAGYVVYSLLSGNSSILSRRSLHLDAFYGWIGAISAFIAWLSLFGLPVLGSILNVIMSSFWASGIYHEFRSAKWMAVIFFVSLGMHYAIFLAGGPAGAPSSRERRREHVTLLVTALLALSVLFGFGLLSASVDDRTLPLPTAREVAALIVALGVFIGAWTIVAKHSAENRQTMSWLPKMSLLGILVSGYFVFDWLDEHVLAPMTQTTSGRAGMPQLVGAHPLIGTGNKCRPIPEYPYVARVTVDKDGTIRLNGFVVSPQTLDAKLGELGPNSGMWLYQEGRTDGKQNHAVVDQVIRLQMKHKLNFSNSDKSDFRDIACLPLWRDLRR
jgi:hypothetical protein